MLKFYLKSKSFFEENLGDKLQYLFRTFWFPSLSKVNTSLQHIYFLLAYGMEARRGKYYGSLFRKSQTLMRLTCRDEFTKPANNFCRLAGHMSGYGLALNGQQAFRVCEVWPWYRITQTNWNHFELVRLCFSMSQEAKPSLPLFSHHAFIGFSTIKLLLC